ncbi:MAG: heavy metal translocating P-type ATPase [Firmicutes bacterium]|nr:heavy metal translocating P-type ATPase [Bacillota bacterium]
MTKKQKKNLIRIIVSLAAFLIILLFDKVIIKHVSPYFSLATVIPNKYGWLLAFGMYFMVYVIIGYDVIWRAVRNIFHGQVFDENFLMVIATFGAFGLAVYRGVTGQEVEGFDEACAVLLFYQVGEWFQSYAVGKSRKDISSLMDVRPDYANVMRDGSLQSVDPSEVAIGEIITIKPGEKVPLDGIVISGSSTLDTKALTGEALPSDVNVGDNVISGTVNVSGTIEVKVLKVFYDSTVAKILDLVENASSQKSKAENFITKFARFYTPTVVTIALILALIPSIVTKQPSVWIYRALSFLVVSCPCALVISIPLSFFAGIGGASKEGILIKGSSYLEKFNRADIFVFDKTGTLTKGNFKVTAVYPSDKRDEILHLAAIAEKGSNHPIAKSIISEYGKDVSENYSIEDMAGFGIVANGDDKILCGNAKLMDKFGIAYTTQDGLGTVIYVAKNDEFVGSILISDEIKPESKQAIQSLNELGAKTVMLTGDNDRIAKGVADELNLSEYKASLLPQDKVGEVEKLLAEKGKNDVLCFVGDGINDAPVLMRSDIGIAMGGVGSDAAIEASDIVLMHDDLTGIGTAKRIAKKTMRIVFENIIFALGIKLIILILSALGITNMWFAVFGDVGVAVIAILNAMRAARKSKSLKQSNAMTA